jgi:hypothetical protein
MFSRSDARYVAKRLLVNGFHHPTICEDVEDGEITVVAYNGCWNKRTVTSMGDAAELLRTEGNHAPGRPLRVG